MVLVSVCWNKREGSVKSEGLDTATQLEVASLVSASKEAVRVALWRFDKENHT